MSKRNNCQPLNILHILRAPVGGLFRHVQDLALEQASRGHRVGILADSNSSDGLTSQKLDHLNKHLALGVFLFPMDRAPALADLKVIKEVGRLCSQHGIDVLHGHGAKGGLYARLGALSPSNLFHKAKAPKRFYTPHGGSLHYSDHFLKGMMYMSIEMVLDRLSDGLIFESQFARTTYEEGLGRPKSKTRIIANGLRNTDFKVIAPDDTAAEFLFIGELRRLKGVDLLLRSLARLEGDPAPNLLIVGDGPDRKEFEQLAEELDLRDRVEFGGVMPASLAFSKGKILVLPSRAESLPYVALEAAAANRPLIATRVGGVPEIVWGTDTTLVAPNNVGALSHAMENALEDFAQTRARAERLRKSVSNRFTVRAMTSAVLEFYQEALANREPAIH